VVDRDLLVRETAAIGHQVERLRSRLPISVRTLEEDEDAKDADLERDLSDLESFAACLLARSEPPSGFGHPG